MIQPSEIELYERFDLATDDEDVEGNAPKPLVIDETDGKRRLVGYAVVWGAVSDLRRDGFHHQFVKGSITWAAESYALWAHLTFAPLAGTPNGTLVITEDNYGARVQIDLDQSSDGINAWERVKAGLVTGMSFGGSRAKGDYKPTANPQIIQPFNFGAYEVSLTIQPAVRETRITTAKNSAQLEKEKSLNSQKNKLATARLSIFR